MWAEYVVKAEVPADHVHVIPFESELILCYYSNMYINRSKDVQFSFIKSNHVLPVHWDVLFICQQ
jgi:hypothetical protein